MLFLQAATATAEEAKIVCTEGIGMLIKVIHTCVNYIQWGIPIALIIYGTVDLGKAVIASKEDEIKTAQKLFIKRAIYAVVIFLIPAIVNVVIDIADTGDEDGAKNWMTYWDSCK